jgi:hypothetical protein
LCLNYFDVVYVPIGQKISCDNLHRLGVEAQTVAIRLPSCEERGLPARNR